MKMKPRNGTVQGKHVVTGHGQGRGIFVSTRFDQPGQEHHGRGAADAAVVVVGSRKIFVLAQQEGQFLHVTIISRPKETHQQVFAKEAGRLCVFHPVRRGVREASRRFCV